jgi:nucleoside-diphosphate-sugar epimerase
MTPGAVRVFVTGGAGFLGINLIRTLLAEGYEVVSYDREPFSYPESLSVHSVEGDIRDRSLLFGAMSGCSMVVHCAAALPLNSSREIWSVDVGGTRNVLEAAKESNVERVVHISSTAVYGVPKHGGIDEESALVGVGPYGEAKIEAEAVVRAFREVMPVAILRPKSFIGPERLGVFSILFDWAITGHHFPIPGEGNNKYQYLDVADLCTAIMLTLQLPATVVNDTFNVGAVDFGTFREDFQAVLDEAGYGKTVKPMPVAPVIWALRFLNRIGLSPLYPWVYETVLKDSFVSVTKIQQVLGWTPAFSNREALLRNFQWYARNRDNFRHQSGKTHRLPWKQGALGLAKVFFQ